MTRKELEHLACTNPESMTVREFMEWMEYNIPFPHERMMRMIFSVRFNIKKYRAKQKFSL